MQMIPAIVRAYARQGTASLRRAPIEVLIGVATAVAFSSGIRQSGNDEWVRVGVAALLAYPTVLTLTFLAARGRIEARTRWGTSAAAVAAAAAYAAFVFSPDRETEGWRAVALGLAALFCVSLQSILGVPAEARRTVYSRFAYHAHARAVQVFAFTGALYVALAGAVAAVAGLFDLKTPEHLYQDLCGLLAFALAPSVLAGAAPEILERSAREEEPRALAVVGRYLYAPVLALYLVILLAYAAKVVATGEIPRNLLSPIVLGAALGGFLGSVFFEPLRARPEHGGLRWLVRWLPVFLLPLLPLALRAVLLREGQHGWTEFRYLRFVILLALVALAVLGVWRLVRRRPPLLIAPPLALAALLAVTAVGPWSAGAVSRRGQEARLQEGLARAGLLREGRLAAALPDSAPPPEARRELPAALYAQITGAAVYLHESHGRERLARALGTPVPPARNGWEVAHLLPIARGCEDREIRDVHAARPDAAGIPLPAGTLYRLDRSAATDRPPVDGSRPVQLQIVAHAVLVHHMAGDPWQARIDLSAAVAKLAGHGASRCSAAMTAGPRGPGVPPLPEPSRFAIVDGAGTRRGELVVTAMALGWPEGSPRGAPRLQMVSALVVLTP